MKSDWSAVSVDEVRDSIIDRVNKTASLVDEETPFKGTRTTNLRDGSKSDWPAVSIDEVCDSIVDCVNKTAPLVDEETPFKMIRTTNVRDGWVSLSDTRRVSAETFEKWTRRQTPRRGDVILAREAPLGAVGMLRSDESVFLGQRLVSYRANLEKLDPHFLLYSLMDEDLQGQILACGSGATVAHMRVPDASKLRIRLPPLPTQRRIASILSAYDDLIENNTKRIEILEEMARSLYREWFVHFRFPGHEKVKLVDSELGKTPEGWEVVSATQVMVVNPRVKVDNSRENFFVPMTSLATGSMLIGDVERKLGNSGSKFMNGDTLFARITPCLENGKTGYVQFLPTDTDVACGSTELIVLREARFCREMVYALSRTDSFRQHAINSMSGASGRQRVKEQAFESYRLACPSSELIEGYGKVAGPMFSLLEALNQKNRVLRQTRDLLIPKLISGAIDVDALDLPEAI